MNLNADVMKKTGLILLPLVCFAFGGCSQVGNEFVSYDEFTSVQIIGVRVQDPGVPCIYTPFTSQLDIIRLQQPGQDDQFAFKANIATDHENIWADRIIWIADGNRITITGTSELSRVKVGQYGVTYYEAAIFPASPEQLRELANAQELAFRIDGKRGRGSRFDLKDNSILAIRSFFHRYVTD